MNVRPEVLKALNVMAEEAVKAIRDGAFNTKELRVIESTHRKVADLAGEVLDVLDPSRREREEW